MKRQLILLILIFLLAMFVRIFQFGQNPASLYWDEASLGYNGYLIATSLHDEHGEYLPLSRFIAFGDYKPPGYIYATVPPIILFGLNEVAVRMPSLLAGLVMVIITYFLVCELFKSRKLALLSAYLLAVSPWAIHFSRAAFEANLAACFNLAGIYFFILSLRKKWCVLPSYIFFILSFYTFNANRIIAPVLMVLLPIYYLRHTIKNIRWLLVSAAVAALLVLVSYSYLVSRESRLRYNEVTIFNNLTPVETANSRIALDGNNIFSKLIHNRRINFATDFFEHYFDNFSGRFLFTHGDVNPRLSVQGMGQLYFLDLPFLLAGFYFLFRTSRKNLGLILLWMAVSVIPAGTARETPHALRIISILPTYQIVIAYGLYKLISMIKKRKVILLIVLCIMLSANIFYYLHLYFVHFPLDWSGEWQYGYKQMVNYVKSVEAGYDEVYITNSLGRPYIYFAFYNQIPLEQFLAEKVAERDWYGFWEVQALGKIKFEGQAEQGKRVLVVTSPDKLPGDFRLLKMIKNPSGGDVFAIGEKI